MQVSRFLRVGDPIELYATSLYTRTMFERFSKELFKSGKFSCVLSDNVFSYHVILLNNDRLMDNGVVEYRVASNPGSTDFFCECKRFEHTGIPCWHIIKVTEFSTV